MEESEKLQEALSAIGKEKDNLERTLEDCEEEKIRLSERNAKLADSGISLAYVRRLLFHFHDSICKRCELIVNEFKEIVSFINHGSCARPERKAI